MFKAAFFGASSVEGAGASSPDRRYSTIVSRSLGWEEINLGLGGSCVVGRDEAGQIVDETSGIARVPDVADAAPELVFVHYGANDFATGKALGSFDVFRQGTFFWDFDTMLRGLRECAPAAELVLSTAQYRADGETPNGQGLTLPAYNQAIARLGDKYGLRVLDPYHGADIDASNFASLSADAAHLNDEGHERLAAFYISHLQTR